MLERLITHFGDPFSWNLTEISYRPSHGSSTHVAAKGPTPRPASDTSTSPHGWPHIHQNQHSNWSNTRQNDSLRRTERPTYICQSFRGCLYGPLDLPTEGFIGDYSKVAPHRSYKVISPMFRCWTQEEKRPCQTGDPAYEEKCRRFVLEYLRTADPLYTEHPRKIESDGIVHAEWQGVFEKSDGSMVFFDVKHRMTMVCLMPIERSYYWYRKSSSIKKQDWKSRWNSWINLVLRR